MEDDEDFIQKDTALDHDDSFEAVAENLHGEWRKLKEERDAARRESAVRSGRPFSAPVASPGFLARRKRSDDERMLRERPAISSSAPREVFLPQRRPMSATTSEAPKRTWSGGDCPAPRLPSAGTASPDLEDDTALSSVPEEPSVARTPASHLRQQPSPSSSDREAAATAGGDSLLEAPCNERPCARSCEPRSSSAAMRDGAATAADDDDDELPDDLPVGPAALRQAAADSSSRPASEHSLESLPSDIDDLEGADLAHSGGGQALDLEDLQRLDSGAHAESDEWLPIDLPCDAPAHSADVRLEEPERAAAGNEAAVDCDSACVPDRAAAQGGDGATGSCSDGDADAGRRRSGPGGPGLGEVQAGGIDRLYFPNTLPRGVATLEDGDVPDCNAVQMLCTSASEALVSEEGVQPSRESEAPTLRFDMLNADETRALITIQAAARGRHDRKRAAALRLGLQVAPRLDCGEPGAAPAGAAPACGEYTASDIEALVRIQAAERGRRGRRRAATLRREALAATLRADAEPLQGLAPRSEAHSDAQVEAIGHDRAAPRAPRGRRDGALIGEDSDRHDVPAAGDESDRRNAPTVGQEPHRRDAPAVDVWAAPMHVTVENVVSVLPHLAQSPHGHPRLLTECAAVIASTWSQAALALASDMPPLARCVVPGVALLLRAALPAEPAWRSAEDALVVLLEAVHEAAGSTAIVPDMLTHGLDASLMLCPVTWVALYGRARAALRRILQTEQAMSRPPPVVPPPQPAQPQVPEVVCRQPAATVDANGLALARKLMEADVGIALGGGSERSLLPDRPAARHATASLAYHGLLGFQGPAKRVAADGSAPSGSHAEFMDALRSRRGRFSPCAAAAAARPSSAGLYPSHVAVLPARPATAVPRSRRPQSAAAQPPSPRDSACDPLSWPPPRQSCAVARGSEAASAGQREGCMAGPRRRTASGKTRQRRGQPPHPGIVEHVAEAQQPDDTDLEYVYREGMSRPSSASPQPENPRSAPPQCAWNGPPGYEVPQWRTWGAELGAGGCWLDSGGLHECEGRPATRRGRAGRCSRPASASSAPWGAQPPSRVAHPPACGALACRTAARPEWCDAGSVRPSNEDALSRRGCHRPQSAQPSLRVAPCHARQARDSCPREPTGRQKMQRVFNTYNHEINQLFREANQLSAALASRYRFVNGVWRAGGMGHHCSSEAVVEVHVVAADGVGVAHGKPVKLLPFVKFVPLVNRLRAKVRALGYKAPHLGALSSSMWQLPDYPVQRELSFDIYPHE